MEAGINVFHDGKMALFGMKGKSHISHDNHNSKKRVISAFGMLDEIVRYAEEEMATRYSFDDEERRELQVAMERKRDALMTEFSKQSASMHINAVKYKAKEVKHGDCPRCGGGLLPSISDNKRLGCANCGLFLDEMDKPLPPPPPMIDCPTCGGTGEEYLDDEADSLIVCPHPLCKGTGRIPKPITIAGKKGESA